VSRHNHPTTFQDSANARSIASGKYAAVYVAHGSYQWAQRDVQRMAGVFGVSENPDPEAAHLARCMAVEQGAARPQDMPQFIRNRHALGHNDALSYSSRADWQAIEQACIDAGVYPWWWIAAPGLSLTECRALRSPIRRVQPVAVQNQWFQGYDESVILRPSSPAMQFTPPAHFHGTG
jgi:hypothetical protein